MHVNTYASMSRARWQFCARLWHDARMLVRESLPHAHPHLLKLLVVCTVNINCSDSVPGRWNRDNIGILLHFTGLSLTCFCQHSRLCEGQEDICQGPSDVCFTRELEDGMYESACYEVGSNLFSPQLVCANDTHRPLSPGELLCCNDRDRCNEDFLPSTQQTSSSGRGSISVTVPGPIITSKCIHNPL